MAHLIYIRTNRGPSPRITEVDKGGNPILGEAERGNVLATHELAVDETAALRAGRLSIAALVKRYPPPRNPDEPAPVEPEPEPPAPAGAAKRLEVV